MNHQVLPQRKSFDTAPTRKLLADSHVVRLFRQWQMDSLFKWMLPPRPLVITLSTAKDFLSSKITRTAEDYFRAELLKFENCSKSFDVEYFCWYGRWNHQYDTHFFKGIFNGIFLDSSVKLWTPKQLYLIFQKRNEKRENTARLWSIMHPTFVKSFEPFKRAWTRDLTLKVLEQWPKGEK